MPVGLSGLVAGDGHVLDQDRAALAARAHQHIAAHRDDALEHLAQVPGDGDLLHREADLAALDPIARGAARVVAGDQVDTVPEQLGDEESASHPAQHAGEIGRALAAFPAQHQIVMTAGVARSLHAELARRIAAEEIAFEHARAHDHALARGDALVVERRAGRALRLERPLLERELRRKHLLAEAVEQEAGLSIEVAAVHRRDEVAEEPAPRRRIEQHGRLTGGDLAPAEARCGALRGIAPERARPGELARDAGARIPVVALHQAAMLGDHRAREIVSRARKAAGEAEAVGEHELRLLRRDRRALGVADHRRSGERRVLAALGELDRLFGAERPRVEKIEILGRFCQQFRFRQACAVILCGVTRNRQGRIHRLLERRARKVGGTGMAAPDFRALAEVDGDADRAVAIVLDSVGLAFTHRHREAVGFRHLAVATAGAGALGAPNYLLRHVAKLCGVEREPVALRHGGAIITSMHDDSVSSPVSKTQRKKEMHSLQALGVELVELPESQLATLGLPEDLAAAVREARRITSHEGKRRQLQYIGRLMREVDAEPIRARLEAILGHSAQEAARHRRLEALRERLLADDAALTEYVASHAGADSQALRTLIRNARREQKEGRPPRASRELFRVLKALETRTAAAG